MPDEANKPKRISFAERLNDGSFVLDGAIVPADEITVKSDGSVIWRGQEFWQASSSSTSVSEGWAETDSRSGRTITRGSSSSRSSGESR
jgi:hypothetical protein